MPVTVREDEADGPSAVHLRLDARQGHPQTGVLQQLLEQPTVDEIVPRTAFFDAARALLESPVPVVAAMAGHAPAGGCVLALCCDYRIMAEGPYRIGLNETQVGLVAPEGIQSLLARVVGPHRAERLLVAGAMPDAAEALRIGLVDELTGIDDVATRARVWLEELLQLPRKPMQETRRIARRDAVAALRPERIDLPRFVGAWMEPDTQAGLRAMLARIGK